MTQKKYPSDLSDAEWEAISPVIPPPKPGGHPRVTDMRRICNGIYYRMKTECPWQFLPKDFPPYSTVYRYYQKWQKKGILRKMSHILRDRARGNGGTEQTPMPSHIDANNDRERGGVEREARESKAG